MQTDTLKKSTNNLWSMLLVLIIAVALYSLVFTYKVFGDDSAFSMWVLGVILICSNFKEIMNSMRRGMSQEILAFTILLITVIPAYLQYHNISFLLITFAIALYFGGLKVLSLLFIPFVILLLAIPNYAQIHLFISYPMRLLETKITFLLLNAIGYDVILAGTSIFVDGKEIIITTACSGIEHLWTLILLAWITTKIIFQDKLIKFLYFAFIVPIFIFFNALRVVATIICMHNWGDSFLSGTPHFIFGITTIVATISLYVLIGIVLNKIGIDSAKR